MEKPQKKHDGWCPALKKGRCHCQFKLANEICDDWQAWFREFLPDEKEIEAILVKAKWEHSKELFGRAKQLKTAISEINDLPKKQAKDVVERLKEEDA